MSLARQRTLLLAVLSLLPTTSQAKVALTPAEQDVVIRRDGFTQGVAIGLISTGAVTSGLSALPFLSAADFMGTEEFGLLRGGIQLGTGVFLAVAGLGGIVGGAYLSADFSRRMPVSGALREQWKAARLKGLGLMLALQGMINTAVALPFLVLSDEILDTLTGNVPLCRIVGQVDLAVGAVHLATGLVLGLVGHYWDPRAFTRLALAPLVSRDRALLTLRVAF